MADLQLSDAARLDLEAIRQDGVERHGAAASEAYMSGFDRLFALLRQHPLAGQARPEFKRSVRALPYRPYRLLYRVNGDVVIIDRVIHQSRDVRRALRKEH